MNIQLGKLSRKVQSNFSHLPEIYLCLSLDHSSVSSLMLSLPCFDRFRQTSWQCSAWCPGGGWPPPRLPCTCPTASSPSPPSSWSSWSRTSWSAWCWRAGAGWSPPRSSWSTTWSSRTSTPWMEMLVNGDNQRMVLLKTHLTGLGCFDLVLLIGAFVCVCASPRHLNYLARICGIFQTNHLLSSSFECGKKLGGENFGQSRTNISTRNS